LVRSSPVFPTFGQTRQQPRSPRSFGPRRNGTDRKAISRSLPADFGLRTDVCTASKRSRAEQHVKQDRIRPVRNHAYPERQSWVACQCERSQPPRKTSTAMKCLKASLYDSNFTAQCGRPKVLRGIRKKSDVSWGAIRSGSYVLGSVGRIKGSSAPPGVEIGNTNGRARRALDDSCKPA